MFFLLYFMSMHCNCCTVALFSHLGYYFIKHTSLHFTRPFWHTGVLRPHGSTVLAAPPIRLPIPNPNPKTHPNPNPIINPNPNPKNKRK